jgi:hypothetical protein
MTDLYRIHIFYKSSRGVTLTTHLARGQEGVRTIFLDSCVVWRDSFILIMSTAVCSVHSLTVVLGQLVTVWLEQPNDRANSLYHVALHATVFAPLLRGSHCPHYAYNTELLFWRITEQRMRRACYSNLLPSLPRLWKKQSLMTRTTQYS